MAVLSERLFVGVPVAGVAAADLSAWQQGSGLPGSPVAAANFHFTLRFLGDCDAVRRDLSTHQLGEAPLGEPFEITTGALGAFPKPSKAAVVWLDPSRGGEALTHLFHAVDEACEDAGFDLEDRPFHPHLTVSRLRPAADVRVFLDETESPKLRIPVKEIVLFESVLARGGAVYKRLESFPLG